MCFVSQNLLKRCYHYQRIDVTDFFFTIIVISIVYNYK